MFYEDSYKINNKVFRIQKEVCKELELHLYKDYFHVLEFLLIKVIHFLKFLQLKQYFFSVYLRLKLEKNLLFILDFNSLNNLLYKIYMFQNKYKLIYKNNKNKL